MRLRTEAPRTGWKIFLRARSVRRVESRSRIPSCPKASSRTQRHAIALLGNCPLHIGTQTHAITTYPSSIHGTPAHQTTITWCRRAPKLSTSQSHPKENKIFDEPSARAGNKKWKSGQLNHTMANLFRYVHTRTRTCTCTCTHAQLREAVGFEATVTQLPTHSPFIKYMPETGLRST